jgi:hypothetical protein
MSTSASSVGRDKYGQCPPGNSIASTPRRLRAAYLDHVGEIVLSSVQTIYTQLTSGKAGKGKISEICAVDK